MRIAVTYENGSIFQHFGHTEQFKLYDAADGQVREARVEPTNGSGHGALAGFLSGLGVDVLICGGIGPGAQTALAEAGIQVCGGIAGDADEAVRAFLAGSLAYREDATCGHHDHDHGHDCGHRQGQCGEHGCGGEGGHCGG